VDLESLLRRILGALKDASVPYMLTGSYASSIHGTPRSTQDLDFVIAPDRDQLDAAGIVRVQGDALDIPYIERWVQSLGLEAQWLQAKAMAR
jgi:hypothetical protein